MYWSLLTGLDVCQAVGVGEIRVTFAGCNTGCGTVPNSRSNHNSGRVYRAKRHKASIRGVVQPQLPNSLMRACHATGTQSLFTQEMHIQSQASKASCMASVHPVNGRLGEAKLPGSDSTHSPRQHHWLAKAVIDRGGISLSVSCLNGHPITASDACSSSMQV